jgi:hypothetical protein
MQCSTAHSTPDASAAAIIKRHSSSVSAMGFSTSTCSPRFAAAMAALACVTLGVTITTPSTCAACRARDTSAKEWASALREEHLVQVYVIDASVG